MNNRPRIYLTFGCQQNWDQMRYEKEGKHCDLCHKTVLDFTSMSVYEIQNYSKGKKDLCGAFTVEQLEPDLIEAGKLISPLKKILVVFLSFISYEIAGSNLRTNPSEKTNTIQSLTPPINSDICKNEISPFLLSTHQDPELFNASQSVKKSTGGRRGRLYFSKRFPFLHYRKRIITPGYHRVD